MQKPPSQKEAYDLHRAGVRALVRALERDRFEVVRADVTGFLRPSKVMVDTPDVVARHRDEPLFAFGLAKTADDIDSDRSRTQLLELGSRMMKDSELLCPLYIATPVSDVDPVRSFLAQLGLAAMPNVRVVPFTPGATGSTAPAPRR